MNTTFFTIPRLGIPVSQAVYDLGRLTRVVYREFCSQADLRKSQRLLARVASTFFMAGYPLMAQTFTPTAAPAQNWVAVTASADGTHLAAVASYGCLYLSENSGATWAAANTTAGGTEPERPWQGVASSADGTKLVAVANFSPIFTSTNSGHTWITNGPSAVWAGVASSADGARLVAVDHEGGRIYTSTDSGQTWKLTSAPTKRWRCIASSADGTRLVAGSDYGTQYGELPAIYTSADSGSTWRLTSAPHQTWQTITSSADGRLLAAGVYGGLIYLSTDAGTNWTAATVPSLHWSSLSSSGHGTKLVAAAAEGQLYVSADAGHTWNSATAPQAQRQAVACSFDGSQSYAAIWNIWNDQVGGIYAAQTLTPVSNISTGASGQAQAEATPPTLQIGADGPNVIVSWPAASTGFQLQQNSSLAPTDWVDVPTAPNQADGRNLVLIPRAMGSHFFRLVQR